MKNETQIVSGKNSFFNPTFQISKHKEEQQKFLLWFNFQLSQITQKNLNN